MGATPTKSEFEVTSIDIIISKANEAGDVTYANPIFFKLAGYSQSELLGQPHSIIRHPDMPKTLFGHLWSRIKSGEDVHTFVKNLRKDGGFYWVYAHIRVAKNPDGSFRNYVSTRKTMNSAARAIIEPLYADMLAAEDGSDMDASLKVLEEFLVAQGASIASFNDIMIKLQNS